MSMEIRDLEDKIRFLLDTYDLWSEEGTYTFPDGDTFYSFEYDYDEYEDDTDDGYALASAGWGTDEDYGYNGYDE